MKSKNCKRGNNEEEGCLTLSWLEREDREEREREREKGALDDSGGR